MGSLYNLRVAHSSGDRPLPDMKKVIEFTVKCHKFLTTKTKPYISEYTRNGDIYKGWRLNQTTEGIRTQFKSPEITTNTAPLFRVRKRELEVA